MAGKYDGRARKIGLYVTLFRPKRSDNWYMRWREPARNARAMSARVVERSTGQSRLELAMKVAQKKDDEFERARLNGTEAHGNKRRILLDHAVRVHLGDLKSAGRGYEHRKKTRQRLRVLQEYLRRDGVRYIDEVTRRNLQDFINGLGRTLKPRTVRNYATTLTGFFNAAMAEEWIEKSPAGIGRNGKLRLPEIPATEKHAADQKGEAKRVPTRAEYGRLVEACDPLTADAVKLIANTGIRYGELMFLVADDVDLEDGTLFVGHKELPYPMPKTIHRLLKDPSRNVWWPKDAANRRIPLTTTALDVLRRRVAEAREAESPWLFPNKAGKPRAHNKALDLLKAAAVASSVMMSADGKSRLGWHTLRRYFVSIASTCMSLPTVLESAGHDSYSMWKLYRETDDDAVREDFKRFDERMGRHGRGTDDVARRAPDN